MPASGRSRPRSLTDIGHGIGEVRASLTRLYDAVPQAVDGDRRQIINALAAARFLEHVCREWRYSAVGRHPDVTGRWQQILSFLAGSIPRLRLALSTGNEQEGAEVVESLRRVAERLHPLEAEIGRLQVLERREVSGGGPAGESAAIH